MSANYLDLFKNCKNFYGKIPDQTKNQILLYLSSPSEPLWEEIHCKIIGADSWTTLWQAVIKVSPDFPKSKPLNDKWAIIPTSEEIYEAVLYANDL